MKKHLLAAHGLISSLLIAPFIHSRPWLIVFPIVIGGIIYAIAELRSSKPLS